MNTFGTNSANKILHVTKHTKTRLSIIALFVLIAVSTTAVFSAATSASSLDKFFENNLPAPIASGLSSVSNAVFGTANFANPSQVVTVQELAPAPSVMTDKDDYQPGEWATITGSGFIYPDADGNPVVESSVILQVLHVDGTPNTGNGHEMMTVSVNGDGTFTTQWYVDPDDSLGAIFKVTAIGQGSGLKAERIFTDGPLAACSNISGTFESLSSGSTTWLSTSARGWKELENVPIRVALSSTCASATPVEQNVQVQFDHHTGQTPGIQDLLDFVPSTGVQIITAPLLDAPANSGVWSYTFKIRLTASTGNVQFNARLSAGSHNFTGNSLQLKGSSVFSLGTIGIFKPAALPGSPDLALTKSGPDNATPGQTVTYTLNYQNKSTAANAATGVQLVDTLPSNVTYVPNSCEGCSVTGSSTITWELGSLKVGELGSKSLRVTMPSVTTGQTITNSAELFLAENDITPTDNRATKATVVSSSVIAPSITTHPQGATKCISESVTFSVEASGTSPNYQWRKGGSNILGATSNRYTIATVSNEDAASYDVVVSNSAGTRTSDAATLTVNTAPSITTEPQGATKLVGEPVTFSVAASGTSLGYQWYKGDPNGAYTPINIATNSSYTIPSVSSADAGSYFVVVSGTCAPSATSNAAILTANKKMPVISWSNPDAITYGTALGSTQLNATASYNGSSVEGNYSYSPLSGAVLNADEQQNLSVTFTPTDTNTYDTPAAKTVKINVLKKQLTVTADNANRAYGAANPSNLTHTITGYVNNENSSNAGVSGSPALNIANTATATAAAGSTHPITAALGTLLATNYSFGFVNGTLTIDRAVVQVSATGSMTYGGTPTLTPSYSGFVNGNTASVISGTPTLSCSTCSGAAAAGTTQTITVADGSPALSATNYSFTFANGSLTVDRAVLTVSATGSMTYGGTPTLTPTYNGFIAGEGVSVLNNTAPALSCSGCAGAAGSTQTITVAAGTLAASNYSFNLVNGSFTVDRASLQITASSPANIQYGAAVPTITAGFNGFVAGDTASSLTTQPNCGTVYTVGSGVGNYTTSCSGAAANNYTITYVPGSFMVNAKTLEIKASSPADISYGSAVPNVTPIYTGFVAPDSITTAPTCGTNYTVGSGVASYTTSCSDAVASANYVINYVSGSFNVTRATASVSAVANSKTYGDAEPTLGTTNSEFLAADLGAGKITFSASRAMGEGFGNYVITPAAGDNSTGLLGNYNVTYTPANFNISKKAATWSTNNNSKTYGAADPNPLTTGSGTGFLATDGVGATYSRVADNNGVGTYAITANLSATVSGALNNYNITNNGADFEITKKALTITASSPANIAFGSSVPSVTPSYDGFITGNNAGNSLTTPPNCTTDYTQGAGVGAYTTSCSGAASNNYSISYVAGGFSVIQANQIITFGTLSNEFIGNGGITVGATGGGSGNAVTFSASGACTNSNGGAVISFTGLGQCTVIASQAGNTNYNAATSVSRSFQVNPDPTTVTLNTAGHTFIDFDCTTNVIAATVKDSVTGNWIQNATVNFVIGSQTVSAITDINGKASAAIILNQPTGLVTVSASYAGSSNGFNSAGSASTTKTIGGSPNVGPGQDATSLYTGSLWFWTTSSTSSTATLTLSATIKDTFENCPGDITKAKVSFLISTNGGSSFSPVSSAQNLPVGLVNPTDPTTGTASAISQYNIGSSQSVTLMVRVVVGGQYNSSSSTYDVPVTIGKPGLANSLMGGGELKNDGMPFPANGFLGANSINGAFGTLVTYNRSGTNPKGDVTVTITSCNKPDGSVEAGCTIATPAKWHKYFIKSNSISELSLISGSASFGSKTNVSELLPDGSKVSLDGGNTMQLVFTPNGQPFPTGMSITGGNCTNQSGCASIVIYKSNGLGGGVWYSSAWGQPMGTTTAPRTYLKNVLGGNVVVQ